MADTTFENGTVIEAEWLQDVNDVVYGLPVDDDAAEGAGLVGYDPNLSYASGTVGAALNSLSVSGTVFGGGNFSNTVFDQSNSGEAFVNVTNTNPQGWNTDRGTFYFVFDFLSTNYFGANPNGHFAIVTRADLDNPVRGQGILFGRFNGETEAYTSPRMAIETWYNGTAGPGDNRVFPGSETLATKLLEDGVTYKCMIMSTKANDGFRYIRYKLWRYNAAKLSWDLERDSGDFLDANIWADLTKQGLTIAHVFADNNSNWSLGISNGVYIWGPPVDVATQVNATTASSGDFDGNLDGNLTFLGNSRRTYIESSNTGSDLPRNFAFQSRNTNTITDVYAIPNGTGNGAGFVAFSKSGQTTSNICLIFSSSTRNELKTAAFGEANNPLYIQQNSKDHVVFNDGTISFPTNATRFSINSSDGTIGNRFIIQDSATNQGTGLIVAPNGTNSNSSLICFNASSTSTFSYAQFGVNASYGFVDTLGVGGGSALPLRLLSNGVGGITIDTDGTVATNATLKINSATQVLGGSSAWAAPIGNNDIRATAIDEEIDPTGIEILAIQGLYAWLGNLVKELKAKKVI